ncbi:c-Myc-binding protein homolog [Diaphorina citri]|uniref:c-Myc-binding protein homolog n=1 Tax=Diaphorina citri TaxID=121845 RepID=A0A1S4E9U5_DIACI|nr:c-Myc-binding protein homolog [Diaphorina citri]KAI5704781.1 hypothetical protein M8J75_008711 [Diaphorina citri]KAI5737110.1 hypothetical protein M8J76_010114 [Diaphorina citri]KAI5744072.1 hypothetical protein M8J77_025407 [Diaphorina citri]
MSFIPETPNEKNKEAFRRYLEQSGVVDAITSALVMLYSIEEKPEDPLDFIRRNLGDERPEVAEYEAVLQDLDEAKAELDQLTATVANLKERLSKYEVVESDQPISDDNSAI